MLQNSSRSPQMNATRPNSTGTVVPVPDGTRAENRNRSWAQWVGYQIQGSVAYADDLTGAKIYAGSDIGSVYVLNATDGSPHLGVHSCRKRTLLTIYLGWQNVHWLH